MAGQVFAEKPKEKMDIIEKVTFKVGKKTYVAEFKNAEIDKISKFAPKGETRKEVNESFGNLAEKYDVVIYEKGKKKPVDDPAANVMAQAGKALVGQAMKVSTVKKLQLIPKKKM